MSIKTKIFVTYIIIITAAVGLLSVIFFITATTAMQKEELTKLEVIADLKVKRIESVFTELKKDVAIAQDFYNIKLNFPVLLRLQNDKNNPLFIKSADTLSAQFGIMLSEKHLLDIRLIDIEGKTPFGSFLGA